MVENWWHFGKEIPSLIYIGGDKKRSNKSYFTLGELWINKTQSHRCSMLGTIKREMTKVISL